MQRIKDSIHDLDAADIALIVVIVIGYIVGVSTGYVTAWPDYSIAVLLVTVLSLGHNQNMTLT